MNDYMRENKIEPLTPTLTAQSQRAEMAAPAAKTAPETADGKPKAKKNES